MTDQNFLEINKVTFSYPGQTSPVLKNISLVLKKPGLYGLAGRNGSGKSTLLRCIYGLADADKGTIRLNGEKITGPAFNSIPGNPKIKLIDQEKKLEMSIRVEENISRRLLAYNSGFRIEKTNFLLKRSGLGSQRKKYPGELSGGQQQMLSICCALAEEPELLLLDEPLVSLDSSARENMLGYLTLLLKDLGTGMILVSHDPRDLLGFTDELIIMKNGRISATGRAEEIFFSPEDEYCAALFGTYSVITERGKKTIYRPSQISISPSGRFRFQVRRRTFKGDYYEITASNMKDESIVAHDSSGTILPGEWIRVDFIRR